MARGRGRVTLDSANGCLNNWVTIVLIKALSSLGILGLVGSVIGTLVVLEDEEFDLNTMALLAGLLLAGGLFMGLGLDASREYRGNPRDYRWTRRLGITTWFIAWGTLVVGMWFVFPQHWPLWLDLTATIGGAVLSGVVIVVNRGFIED